jgi:hypothetical protein
VEEPIEHKLYAFRWDGSSFEELLARDEAVIPSRTGDLPTARHIIWHESILADIDDDDRVEIIAPSHTRGLFAWEYDTQSNPDSLRPERGWPMLFSGAVMTPALVPEGMLVSSYSERVHYLKLAGTPTTEWRQYGADERNRGFHEGCGQLLTDNTPIDDVVLELRPIPFNPVQTVRFSVPMPSWVELQVYDILGRRVRSLVRQNLPRGLHEARWDGRDQRNNEVASGVYFVRLGVGNVERIRRTVLVR